MKSVLRMFQGFLDRVAFLSVMERILRIPAPGMASRRYCMRHGTRVAGWFSISITGRTCGPVIRAGCKPQWRGFNRLCP